VLEHGGLCRPEQRARAIETKIPMTVQHPLFHDLAFGLFSGWGTKRTADADVVAYKRDLMIIPGDQPRALRPAFTMVGGRRVAPFTDSSRSRSAR
jgi:hypothetical protein